VRDNPSLAIQHFFGYLGIMGLIGVPQVPVPSVKKEKDAHKYCEDDAIQRYLLHQQPFMPKLKKSRTTFPPTIESHHEVKKDYQETQNHRTDHYVV
jgi:hypothetical protein